MIKNLNTVAQLFFIVKLVFNQMCFAQTETNTNWTKTVINKPAIIVVMFDSLEIEDAKLQKGEENFYTAMDDLMWYNAELIEKMENERIPLLYFEQDSLFIESPVQNFQIVKDSTFSVYTYFKFNGSQLQRTDLLELLDY